MKTAKATQQTETLLVTTLHLCNWGLAKTFIFIFISAILLACSNNHFNKMTETESNNIIKDVKSIYDKITEYSQKAQLDSFLSYYDDSPDFLSFSSDGKMSNYEGFKRACSKYYNSLKEQKVITIHEKFHVIDATLVIVGWTGNITATFKNGDTLKMDTYSITSVFKKIDGRWKIIHDHESALPPEVIKKG